MADRVVQIGMDDGEVLVLTESGRIFSREYTDGIGLYWEELDSPACEPQAEDPWRDLTEEELEIINSETFMKLGVPFSAESIRWVFDAIRKVRGGGQ